MSFKFYFPLLKDKVYQDVDGLQLAQQGRVVYDVIKADDGASEGAAVCWGEPSAALSHLLQVQDAPVCESLYQRHLQIRMHS